MDANQHPLNDYNGVVDEHPHGDHHGAKRNTLERDISERHNRNRAAHREQQHGTDHRTGAPAHKNAQHTDDCSNADRQISKKGPDGLLDHHVLPVNRVERDADWLGFKQPLQRLIDLVANVHHVLALPHRNTEGDRLDAIETNEVEGLIHRLSSNASDVA